MHRCDRGPEGRTVLLLGPDGAPWRLVRSRAWDRWRARWHALTLDAQLAAGEPVDTDRLRAVRAGMLVGPQTRDELATGWSNLVAGRGGRRSVPVQRRRVVAATEEIEQLISALRVAQPVAARGVAIASLLLTDGTGPLYHLPSTVDLPAAVSAAVRHMDPRAAMGDVRGL